MKKSQNNVNLDLKPVSSEAYGTALIASESIEEHFMTPQLNKVKSNAKPVVVNSLELDCVTERSNRNSDSTFD